MITKREKNINIVNPFKLEHIEMGDGLHYGVEYKGTGKDFGREYYRYDLIDVPITDPLQKTQLAEMRIYKEIHDYSMSLDDKDVHKDGYINMSIEDVKRKGKSMQKILVSTFKNMDRVLQIIHDNYLTAAFGPSPIGPKKRNPTITRIP
jgi:hypothetical protein